MTRLNQWKAVRRALLALAAVGLITAAASVEVLRVGAAAAGLLYMLPVLWVSARAGLNAGLAAAFSAAFCYNFFLLDPRYTLRIRGVGDVAAFAVLTLVAVVTSRLASGLRASELEARSRAEASEAEAELATLLARVHDRAALDEAALATFDRLFGDAHLVTGRDLVAKRSGLAPLEAAAAAWALHHHMISGAATEIMPAADRRFVPLARGGDDVLALAASSPADRYPVDFAQALARVWVQARDRLSVDAERQAREQAEARDHVRRALLAALGHDFRTPLTVLKSGLAEMGGDGAARLGREIDRLVRLSADLIASARMEGGASLVLEPVDVVDIVASALPVGEVDARVTLATAIPDDLPLVRADAVALVHVLGNLLDNAVRHARSRVELTARAEDGTVRIEVTDDGEGIDPAIGDTLFDRFVTVTDREGGSGLGLSIARDLAVAMGAKLTAAAAPDGGARFSIVLRAELARVESAA